MMRLKGKTAIITGGGDGIGHASALLFAREGASKIAIVDFNAEKGKETVGLLRSEGIEALFIETDVRQSSDVQSMVGTVVEHFGRIDILVNNAGVAGAVPVVDLSEDDWDRIIDTDLKSVFLCSKYVIPEMIKAGGGCIVNLASVLGIVARVRTSAYAAAKGGVILLTKNMALDYVSANIRINAVCPGFVMTELVRKYINRCEDPEQTHRELADLHPMGRLAQPEEIAHAVLFLASGESSFVTGSSLVIDGGYSAR
jgi:NAD(P)-dependent dehydrogenase (short-subunit alcohol dehydrogenase family)